MPEPRKMTRAQLLAEGGTIEESPAPRKMTRAQLLAEGGTITEDAPPESDQSKLEAIHGPATTGALNVLDSASFVGIPTVLGMKDALSGIDSASKEEPNEPMMDSAKRHITALTDTPFRDRYYKNKKFYEDGMARSDSTNKKSAIAGQILPAAAEAFIPGGQGAAATKLAKVGQMMKLGVGTGMAQGALRGKAKTLGDSTNAPDVTGTAVDTAVGGAVGGAAALAGGVAGKAVEGVGNLGRGAYARILSEVQKRTASKIGRAGKYAGEHAGAIKNLNLVNELEGQVAGNVGRGSPPNIPGNTGVPIAQQQRGLDRIRGNAKRALADEKALYDKHGTSLHAPRKVLNAENLKNIQGEANQSLKQLGIVGVVGAAGAQAAKAVGVNPAMGALAAGGAGGHYLMRKASQAIGQNPAAMRKLMQLAPVGRAMARLGAGAATSQTRKGVPPTSAMLYSLAQSDPEVKAALLKEYEADQNGRSE